VRPKARASILSAVSDTSRPTARSPGGLLFQVAWWVLVVLTGLFALNHIVGAVAFASSTDERLMFTAFAALQLLALVVLLIPYRRGEMWAWWAIWIPVAMMILALAFSVDGISIAYSSVGVVMALAQVATLPRFRASTAQLGAPT